MHVASPETVWDSSAASCQTPHRPAPAKQSGDPPHRSGGAGLFAGFSTKGRESGEARLTDLPCEIVRYTARYLDTRSIGALAQTCHYLKDAVRGMVVEKIAHRYYGPPGSESRRQYDTLCTPLARRLWPATECDNASVPLSQEQQARQRLHQITRLRSLSQSGKLSPTCETLEKDGYCTLLTTGLSRAWGACVILCGLSRFDGPPYRERLYIFVTSPTPSFIEALPIKQRSYYDGAEVLPDGHIVIASSTRTLPTADTNIDFFLALCKHDNQADTVQQVLLPGTHSGEITCFKQLPDGRVVSASYDKTLKIRPLEPLDDTLVVTLTGHQDRITGMLLFTASRCITSSVNHTLKIWDLSRPSQEYCLTTLTTLTDMRPVTCKLHKLNDNHFLSEIYPNITFVWKLTDSSAVHTALIDPDWPSRLRTKGYRTAKETPYDLSPNPNPIPSEDYMLNTYVLPGSRIVIQHHNSIRLCDTAAVPSEPKRLCILARNNSGAVSRSVPIYPIGPSLTSLKSTRSTVDWLPDGRLLHAEQDGTLHCYDLDAGRSTRSATLGNFFASLPQEYQNTECDLEWITVMDDGRLLLSIQMTGRKTLLFVYDPYALPKDSDNPAQEY